MRWPISHIFTFGIFCHRHALPSSKIYPCLGIDSILESSSVSYHHHKFHYEGTPKIIWCNRSNGKQDLPSRETIENQFLQQVKWKNKNPSALGGPKSNVNQITRVLVRVDTPNIRCCSRHVTNKNNLVHGGTRNGIVKWNTGPTGNHIVEHFKCNNQNVSNGSSNILGGIVVKSMVLETLVLEML